MKEQLIKNKTSRNCKPRPHFPKTMISTEALKAS